MALGHLAVDPSPIRPEFQHLTAFHDKDVLCRDAHLFGHAGMVHQVTIFAVNGHKKARPGEVEHQLVFLAAGVA